jgi:hypothetical protein
MSEHPTIAPPPPSHAPASRPDYVPVITLAILVAASLIARALDADELSIAFGSGALGYAGAHRSALSPAAVQRATTVLVFVAACAASLIGCGAAVLATCTENEAAIVALPCGALTAAECRARDLELLATERARCDAEMAGVP